MLLIATVREAEPWTAWNIFGAFFLLFLIAAVVYWAIKRRR
ncbi:MAG: hypothetical protein ABFR89_10455 [Actinomycetota bacterium]